MGIIRKFLCHEVSLLKDYLHTIYLFLTTKTVATVGYLTFTWAEGQKLRRSVPLRGNLGTEIWSIWSNWSILSYVHFQKAEVMYFQKKKEKKKLKKKSLVGNLVDTCEHAKQESSLNVNSISILNNLNVSIIHGFQFLLCIVQNTP